MSKLSKQKIAITGTIGSGKSSVTDIIAKSYKTISADDVVAELYTDKKFVELVNREILNINCETLDKNKLSNIIFNDTNKKAKLEAIIHPLVRKSINNWLDNNNGFIFVEVPLLFEAKFDDLFDAVIVVVADKAVILERLEKYRGYSYKESLLRIAQQFSVSEKIKQSDYIIYNNDTYSELEKSVKSILNKIEKGE